MTRLAFCALGAALLTVVSASGAMAQASTPAPAPAASPPAATAAAPTAGGQTNADDPMICKREEVTGSRLGGTRTCMTKSQWAQQAAAAEQQMMHVQTNASAGARPN
jgi:hypothetical protein